jgi:hypothetical protein
MYDSLLAVVCDLHENMECLFHCGNFDGVLSVLSIPDEGYSRNVFLLYLFLAVVSQGSLLFLQCIIFFFSG